MSRPEVEHAVTSDRFDAVLFDLDGVLTDTARIHAACWKTTFDDFLRRRAAARGEEFCPFEIETDYHPYVDGKPRFDGVRDFLHSRGIELPEGEPDASPDEESVCGVGNRKNRMVNQAIRTQGVESFPESIAWLRRVRAAGLKTAVVSSSSNCQEVLQAAKIEDLFDFRMDGKVAARLGLPGKPAPETFLRAARELHAAPARAVVVEDAIAGVQAGRAGSFGLVIAVASHASAEELRGNGAHVVVRDLGQVPVGV